MTFLAVSLTHCRQVLVLFSQFHWRFPPTCCTSPPLVPDGNMKVVGVKKVLIILPNLTESSIWGLIVVIGATLMLFMLSRPELGLSTPESKHILPSRYQCRFLYPLCCSPLPVTASNVDHCPLDKALGGSYPIFHHSPQKLSKTQQQVLSVWSLIICNSEFTVNCPLQTGIIRRCIIMQSSVFSIFPRLVSVTQISHRTLLHSHCLQSIGWLDIWNKQKYGVASTLQGML